VTEEPRDFPILSRVESAAVCETESVAASGPVAETEVDFVAVSVG